MASVRPGVTAEQVDAAAAGSITDGGLAERFIHRTGHGIGLDVHEEPYIVGGNARPLEPGMAFSVEPGVYLDGEWGARIEDIVVVHRGRRRAAEPPPARPRRVGLKARARKQWSGPRFPRTTVRRGRAQGQRGARARDTGARRRA